MRPLNLTSCFITPILEFSSRELKECEFQLYIGNFKESVVWGEFLYLTLREDKISEALDSKIKNHQ